MARQPRDRRARDLGPRPLRLVEGIEVLLKPTRFEERWQIGGFAFLGAFYDIMVDERANAFAAEFVRGKIRATVHDPETAFRLSPTQTIGCKRLCVDSGGYYETFNQPHVRLVDVNDQPIERITPRGVEAGGREYGLDALVSPACPGRG